jgi:hypothetical protein
MDAVIDSNGNISKDTIQDRHKPHRARRQQGEVIADFNAT